MTMLGCECVWCQKGIKVVFTFHFGLSTLFFFSFMSVSIYYYLRVCVF